MFMKRTARTMVLTVAAVVLCTASALEAASLRAGIRAFNRADYGSASRMFIPPAESGAATAQTYLGFMFETGRGVRKIIRKRRTGITALRNRATALRNIGCGCFTTRGRVCRAMRWRQQVAQSCHRRNAAKPGKRGAVSRRGDHQDDPRRDRTGPVSGAGVGPDPRALGRRDTPHGRRWVITGNAQRQALPSASRARWRERGKPRMAGMRWL
jgi:hypothetical protein